MRTIYNLNTEWSFSKEATAVPVEIVPEWESVNLPHTWNAIDGQDGGNDYFRGTAYYAKTIQKSELPAGERYFLEIRGANSSADVYMDGTHLAHHDGGYSTWRVDITDSLKDSCVLAIAVDNAPNDKVYPQMADFTFYGGLYRTVSIIAVPASHFDLEYYGGPGIQVTPIVNGDDADVAVTVYLTDAKPEQQVRYTLFDRDGGVVAEQTSTDTTANFTISNVHKWHGRKDPYLYTATAQLVENGEVIDEVTTRFGCRKYEIDPDRGFILNGE
ncbi:MAG: glycoside hydrolase family 2 protein, partial [Clostridia bacterium]|nr:glycoside hydrolase family 2 protein [Clostridia bacterium]